MSNILSGPLSSGILQSSFQRLYKPTTNLQAELSAFWLENVSNVSTVVEIKFLLNGKELSWIKSLPLEPGDKAELIDDASIGLFDSDEIQGRATSNNQVNFNIFGKTKIK